MGKKIFAYLNLCIFFLGGGGYNFMQKPFKMHKIIFFSRIPVKNSRLHQLYGLGSYASREMCI